MKKKKVMLVNPAAKETEASFAPKVLPLALLALSSTIEERYHIVLVDRALCHDNELLIQQIRDPDLFCIGISVLTGSGILDAIYCSKLVRKQRPDITIVWGGWHVTQVPGSLLDKPYIDFVIQGEGEIAFAKLLTKIESGNDITCHGSVDEKSGSWQAHLLEPEEFIDLNELPSPPLHLLDNIDSYVGYNWIPDGHRCLPMESSRGCPHACTFCEITSYFGKRYRFLPAETVVRRISVMHSRFDIGGIRFFDPNFFLNIGRARAVAKMLLSQGHKIKWGADGTIIQFRNVSKEDLRLFHRAGLQIVSFGVESGSERVREEILNKKFSHADCLRVVENFNEIGIQFKFNIILGLPGESLEETLQTIDFAVGIIKRFPNASIGGHMYIYMPFSETPLAKAAEDAGYHPATTLEDFARISYFSANDLPWLTRKQRVIIETSSVMSYFLNAPKKAPPHKGFKKLLYAAFRKMYLFRMSKHLFFRTPDISYFRKRLL